MPSVVPNNERDRRLAELKAAIDAGIAEIDAGLCGPLDIKEIKAELRAKLDEHGRPRSTIAH
jgi:predicted transcriptional regulator